MYVSFMMATKEVDIDNLNLIHRIEAVVYLALVDVTLMCDIYWYDFRSHSRFLQSEEHGKLSAGGGSALRGSKLKNSSEAEMNGTVEENFRWQSASWWLRSLLISDFKFAYLK